MVWLSKENLVYVVRCEIWYHLYNLKNVKNTHGTVLILVKIKNLRNNCTHGTKSHNASHMEKIRKQKDTKNFSLQILYIWNTTQKMKLFIKDFFIKFDQIHRKLWTWSHLLNKSLIKNFIFCVVKQHLKRL